MEKILKKYQERLINLSSRNMSLVINKIVKKRSFDLLSVENIVNGKSEEIIEFINKNAKSINLIPNPEKVFVEAKREVKERVKLISVTYPELPEELITQVRNSLDKILDKFDDVDKDEILSALKNKLDDDKKIVLEAVKHYLMLEVEVENEKLKKMSKHLDYLYREIELEKKETGISNLFIAYGIIEGKFFNKSNCRAPLSLLSVELQKVKGEWKILNNDKKELQPNKVFLFSGLKNNEIKNTQISEFEYMKEQNIQDQFIDYYKSAGMEIEGELEQFKTLPAYTAKESYKKYTEGELVVKSHIVLGRFPTSNAIYEDYSDIIKSGLSNVLIDTLLKSNSSCEADSYCDNEGVEISENSFFFISNLDYSQELVLKSVADNNSTVIFGPPGTGKSETIANIIADALAKNKKVLMVSQKRAALDVVYNRLAPIKNKMALIHDAESGKKEFYHKIRDLIVNFEENYAQNFYHSRNRETYNTGHKELFYRLKRQSTEIEKNLDEFRNIYRALYKHQLNGEKLHDMYHMVWKKDTLTDDENHLFTKYMENGSFFKEVGYTNEFYMSLREKVLEDDVFDDYISVVKIQSNNTLISKVKECPDFSSYYEYKEKMTRYEECVEKAQEKLGIDEYATVHHFYKENNNKENIEECLLNKIENDFGNLKKPLSTGLSRVFKMMFKKQELLSQEKANIELFEQIKEAYLNHYEEIINVSQNVIESIKPLKGMFPHDVIDDFNSQIVESFEYPNLEILADIIENYEQYSQSLENLQSCSDNDIKIFKKLDSMFENDIEKKAFIEKLPELVIYDFLINKLNYDSEIRLMNSALSRYSDLKSDTKSVMLSKTIDTIQYIEKLWDSKFLKAARASSVFTEFKRLAGLKQRFRPIRNYMETYSDELTSLFPCFLMSPETVSKVLPLNKDMFDLIIFDEASQMYVEDAIPSLLRAKKAVVAGDDKQLKPSGLFSKKYDPDEEYDDQNAAALEEESLLDLSKVSYYPSYLNFHYRSKYPELINFSNYAFYDGTLKLAPNTKVEKHEKPIERIFIKDALWENRANKEEAVAVVNQIREILKNRNENETIGVITFNTTQKDLIQDYIDIEASKDEAFQLLIAEERIRKDGDEDVSLFVKNIENVQGDERDIIIFSTGYAKNEKGKLVQQFGSLSQAGGENRLNVAVSRAKKKVFVVTSFEPEELRVENAKQIGPVRFKQYLEYVKAIGSGNEDLSQSILQSISKVDSPDNGICEFDSPFENEVYDELTRMGYNVATQVKASGYSIDLAIFNEEYSEYILAIECDGRTYHSSPSARERDIHRQKFLESRGWKFERIWSSEWWSDKGAVLKRVKTAIEREEKIVRNKYAKNK